MLSQNTQKELDKFTSDLISNFSSPELITGCEVLGITDKDEYADNNGWIEALCGKHNNQRCRWTGQLPDIQIGDYVDVIFYPSYRLFVVFGQGGNGASKNNNYLLTDGSRDSTGLQDFTAGIKADAIAESTAAAGVTVDGVKIKDGDVYPAGDTNGLAARFERLFGDDVPASAYKFTNRLFTVNDFTNHKAGFEDVQSSPYSFGGAPGGFSLSLQSGHSAQSTFYSHFLTMLSTAGTGAGSYLEWTSATDKTICNFISGITPIATATDYTVAEFRLWAVQSPGASDNYWMVRWRWMGSTYPQWPFRIGLWYVAPGGAGETIVSETQVAGGAIYKHRVELISAPACFLLGDLAEGVRGIDISAVVATMPVNFKTARFYIYENYNQLHIDEVIIT